MASGKKRPKCGDPVRLDPAARIENAHGPKLSNIKEDGSLELAYILCTRK